jgi:hypothetical protein
MADERISVEIVLDDGSIQKGFVKMEKAAADAANSAEKSFSGFSDGISKKLVAAGTALAGALAAFATGVAFKKGIEEAIQAENALKRFNLSLANNGLFSAQASESFQLYAEELEKTRAVSADLILEQSALLVSLGRLSGEGLKKATSAALDLSAGLGIDASSAFELLSKAAAGNTGALSRYGIKIDETLPRAERFANALAIIEKKFGGQSAAAASTFDGALIRVGLQFDNLLQSLGELVTKSPAIKETLKIVADVFGNLGKSIDSFQKTGAIDQLILKLTDVAIVIAKFVLPVVDAFVDAFVVGVKTIRVVMQAQVTALTGLASVIVDLFVKPISMITTGYAELVGLFDSKLGKQLKEKISGIAAGISTPFGDAFAATKDVLEEQFSGLTTSVKDSFGGQIPAEIALWLEDYKIKIEAAVEANKKLKGSVKKTAVEVETDMLSISDVFSKVVGGFQAAATDFRDSAVKNFADAGRAAFTTFGQGVGTAFANVGKALQKGENALEAFGNSFLQTLGQVAVQMGSAFILQGLAALFAPGPAAAIGITNPAGLIAAGAALAAFGGILSSSGGGGAPSGAASGGGVASSPGGGLASSPDNPASDIVANAPTEPKTSIAVNIQGDVLDSQESSLRIVDLLNSAFDQQGVTVTG